MIKAFSPNLVPPELVGFVDVTNGQRALRGEAALTAYKKAIGESGEIDPVDVEDLFADVFHWMHKRNAFPSGELDDRIRELMDTAKFNFVSESGGHQDEAIEEPTTTGGAK